MEDEVKEKTRLLGQAKEKAKALENAAASSSSEAKELSKQVKELESLQKQVNSLQEVNTQLNTEKVRQEGTLQRMKAEADAVEVKYGQRTALVGVLESELGELKEKLTGAEEKEKQARELSESFKTKLKEAEGRVSTWKSRAQEDVAKAEKEMKEAKETADRAVADTEKKWKGELQKVRKEMQRKSANAQDLYKNQTEAIKALKKEKDDLKEEVDSGSAADRKIFELAQKQSSREATVAAEIEIREAAVRRMMKTLVGRDGEVADMEMKYTQVKKQLEEYSRMSQRNDVNVEYLKGVLVKYLGLPSGSSERKSLLGVLATLLQFGPEDYKSIEQGYKQVSWFWGGAVQAKEIGVSRGKAAAATNAGVVRVNNLSRAATTPRKEGAREGGQEALKSTGEESPAAASASPNAASPTIAPSSSSSSGGQSAGNIGEVKVSGVTTSEKPRNEGQQSSRKKKTSMQF